MFGNGLASSRRAYTTCARLCSSFSPPGCGRSSSTCRNPSRSGFRNCAWGPPRQPAARWPAATQRSEKEYLFSMVPPLGRDRALSNYHRSMRAICPHQSTILLIFLGECVLPTYIRSGRELLFPASAPGTRTSDNEAASHGCTRDRGYDRSPRHVADEYGSCKSRRDGYIGAHHFYKMFLDPHASKPGFR